VPAALSMRVSACPSHLRICATAPVSSRLRATAHISSCLARQRPSHRQCVSVPVSSTSARDGARLITSTRDGTHLVLRAGALLIVNARQRPSHLRQCATVPTSPLSSTSVRDGTRPSTHHLRPRAQCPSSLLIYVQWCPSLPHLIHVYAHRRLSLPHLCVTAPVPPPPIHVKCDGRLVHTSSTSMRDGALLIHSVQWGPSRPHLIYVYARQ
jgi:hypothetical protein